VKIQRVALSDDQTIAILYGTGRDDDEPDAIHYGTLDEAAIDLTHSFEMDDVVSLCAVPSPFEHEFLAMDGDGTLLWFGGGAHRTEKIVGAGNGDSAKSAGRMSELQVSADRVFALGFGAQAYQCDTPEAGWTDCAVGLSAKIAPEDTLLLTSAMIHLESGVLHVGGTLVGGTRPDAEEAIDAANDAGDAELLAELLLGNVKNDRGALWRHGSEWEEVPLPIDDPVVDLFSLPSAVVVLAAQAEILSAADGEPFQRRSDERPDGYLKGFCRYRDRVLLSFSESLFTFDGQAFERFADSPFADAFFDLVETPLGLLAASEKKVLRLDGDGWHGLKVKRRIESRVSIG